MEEVGVLEEVIGSSREIAMKREFPIKVYLYYPFPPESVDSYVHPATYDGRSLSPQELEEGDVEVDTINSAEDVPGYIEYARQLAGVDGPAASDYYFHGVGVGMLEVVDKLGLAPEGVDIWSGVDRRPLE